MKKAKRILAFLAIVLLIAMYAATFILAFFKNETAQALFRASLGCTILVPIFLYIFVLLAKRSRPEKSKVIDGIIFADRNVLQEEDGRATYFAEELQRALWRKGYQIHHCKGKLSKSYLTDLEQNSHFQKEKILYIDTDQASIALAKKSGYPAMRFTDYPTLIEELESLGIRL